jgi:anti-anti-sigma factor
VWILDGKLDIKVSFYKDMICIVKISGEFTVFIEEFDILYKELMAYTKMGIYQFIINMNDLSYIDSSGIGVIMRLATYASKHTSLICAICDQPQILKILSISKVDNILHFVKTVEEGISYYETRNDLKDIKK